MDSKQVREAWVENAPVVTVGTALFTLAVYSLQLLYIGDVAPNAAFEVPRTLQAEFDLLAVLVSPWLHSSHGHVAANIFALLLFGFLTEPVVATHVQVRRTLLIPYVSALTVALGRGALAVGISSLVYGLAGVAIVQGLREHSSDREALRAGFSGLTAVLGVLYIGYGLSPLVGLRAFPPGVSVGGHLVGAGLGVALAVIFYPGET